MQGISQLDPHGAPASARPRAADQAAGDKAAPQESAVSSASAEDAAVVEISTEAAGHRAANGAAAQQEPAKESDPTELSDEEQREVEELKQRDREVRAHEQAHLAALGAHKTGGPSYEYKTGPDGKQYAVGGEVPVDTSPEAEPEQTVQKMQTIQRAALAPAEPSGQDRAVAAKAAQLESQARAELAKEKSESSETTAEPAAEGAARTAAAKNYASDGICPVCGESAEAGHSHTRAVA